MYQPCECLGLAAGGPAPAGLPVGDAPTGAATSAATVTPANSAADGEPTAMSVAQHEVVLTGWVFTKYLQPTC